MRLLSYAEASVSVRGDLPAAHRRAWQRLAEPGTWWSGAERVAIAAEVRNAERCPLCRERRIARSPHAAEGLHESLGALSEAAVDVIHRVTTTPGQLSRSWYEKTLAAGLGEEAYVEIVGVVVTLVSIDQFCRGLGVPPHPLPEPRPGEPSRRRPPEAEPGVAWVPMIPAGGGTGPDADLFSHGRVANVLRALSLVPDEVRNLRDLSETHYLTLDLLIDPSASRGALDRRQMELIAGRVSALNECFY